MLVYRFKVTFEDYEDVSREIDIKSIQTFYDLHQGIQASVKFDDSQPASFYMSNDQWKKGEEISSHPKKNKEGNDAKLMKDSRLCDFVADPHQKIYYVFDFNNPWSFYIELIKITPAEHQQTKYPSCTKTAGDAPKQYAIPLPQPDPEDFEIIDDEPIDSVVAEETEEVLDPEEEIGVVAEDGEEPEVDEEGEIEEEI